jgi:hypothetical protein
MRLVWFVVLATMITSSAMAAPSTRVKAYTTKKGKLIGPSHRTKANKTKLDNYGTKGNTNPFTGKTGKRKAF